MDYGLGVSLHRRYCKYVLPSATTFRLSLICFLLWGLLLPAMARDRGARVEVACPAAPIPVKIDQQRVLVYELHVTNFDTVPLTLKRVQVFANEENGEPLSTLENDPLQMAIVRVGATMGMGKSGDGVKDTRVIAPGGRNVLFMWVELASNQPIPSSLKHRMIFSPGAGETNDTTLDDFQVPVSRDAVPKLSPPFHGGIWLAGDGPANHSGHRRSIFAIDGHIHLPERFAIDWVKVGPNGDTWHGDKTKNENSWGWGEAVLAVADGEITEVVNGIPDNTPGVLPPVTLDNIAGNHVILKITANRFVTYAHLQNGSIRVRVHDHVHQGDVLGLLGNSGNSTGAHLHLQVTDGNSVLQSEGVPFVFASFTYLGPGSDYPEKQVSIPWTNSIPPGNGVVQFEPAKEPKKK
jgi:murein DD-endopeptidase